MCMCKVYIVLYKSTIIPASLLGEAKVPFYACITVISSHSGSTAAYAIVHIALQCFRPSCIALTCHAARAWAESPVVFSTGWAVSSHHVCHAWTCTVMWIAKYAHGRIGVAVAVCAVMKGVWKNGSYKFCLVVLLFKCRTWMQATIIDICIKWIIMRE